MLTDKQMDIICHYKSGYRKPGAKYISRTYENGKWVYTYETSNKTKNLIGNALSGNAKRANKIANNSPFSYSNRRNTSGRDKYPDQNEPFSFRNRAGTSGRTKNLTSSQQKSILYDKRKAANEYSNKNTFNPYVSYKTEKQKKENRYNSEYSIKKGPYSPKYGGAKMSDNDLMEAQKNRALAEASKAQNSNKVMTKKVSKLSYYTGKVSKYANKTMSSIKSSMPGAIAKAKSSLATASTKAKRFSSKTISSIKSYAANYKAGLSTISSWLKKLKK